MVISCGHDEKPCHNCDQRRAAELRVRGGGAGVENGGAFEVLEVVEEEVGGGLGGAEEEAVEES